MRLLLAEDERELSAALTAILRHNNYSVDTVFCGRDALDYGEADNYDCLILDIMMPAPDGLEVLRRLRLKGITTPVLLLTARCAVSDRIAGLDSGADDYLTKPFSTGELLARIRALLRRRSGSLTNCLSFGDVSLNCETFELSCGEHTVRLRNKEYQMMELMMREAPRLISTERFMKNIWGYDAETEINVVWVYISNLRKILHRLESSVRIEATRGLGYYLADGSLTEKDGSL